MISIDWMSECIYIQRGGGQQHPTKDNVMITIDWMSECIYIKYMMRTT